jgi:D-alanyl-D-alanine carboxypeptidase
MRHFCQFLGIALLSASSMAGFASEKAPRSAYLGAIVTEAGSGQVLFEDNADAISPPASMTKLMTFAVLHDKITSGALTLQTQVHVTHEDAKIGMLRDSTSVWLKENEVFTVEELIYAMMIQSANDAAYTLAHNAAGSTEAFVELMNAKARSLNMTHTTFRSPHGLPPPSRRIADGDLTTPRDFAALCRYLVLETDVLKYTSVRTRMFGVGQRPEPVKMDNHNHLLGSVDGLDGLKTGYTAGAGFCLSATAERHGRRVIAVVMGGGQRVARDVKTKELIERGFASLPPPTNVSAPKVATNPAAQKETAAPGKATSTTEEIPTVKVNRAADTPAQSSTTSDLSLTFQVPASK